MQELELNHTLALAQETAAEAARQKEIYDQQLAAAMEAQESAQNHSLADIESMKSQAAAAAVE